MNKKIDGHMIFAMQLADAAELAGTLKLTIDCNGNYISVTEWTGASISNSGSEKELYSATSIQAIIGWLDGVVHERNRTGDLS